MRNVFFSFLGTGKYKPCIYSLGNDKGDLVDFVQEDLVKRICSKWTKNDIVYIFLTKEAKKTNWDGRLNNKLNNLHLNTKIEPINIPTGRNESEVWEIFDRIYSLIKVRDQITFDITNSLRYLPMLLIPLIEYAKTLKEITVNGVYYGAFEVQGESESVPIFNLIVFSQLMDWTNATSGFVKHGTSIDIVNLVNKTYNKDKELINFTKQIKSFTEDILFIRGKDIIGEKNKYKKIKETIGKISERKFVIKAVDKLIERINYEVEKYKDGNIKNGFLAVQWCLEHDLYPQAITILYETAITYIIKSIGTKETKITDRELIGSAIFIITNNLKKEGWDEKAKENEEKINKIIRFLQDNELYNDLSSLNTIRNDINHAGFRDGPSKVETLKKNIKQIYENLRNKL